MTAPEERWTYDMVADAYDAILCEGTAFEAELWGLVHHYPDGSPSVLDRKICGEFSDEIRGAIWFVIGVLFWRAGWTEREFDDELGRRCDLAIQAEKDAAT